MCELNPLGFLAQALWGEGTVNEKLRQILKATTTHAARLALYAFMYKTIYSGARPTQATPLSMLAAWSARSVHTTAPAMAAHYARPSISCLQNKSSTYRARMAVLPSLQAWPLCLREGLRGKRGQRQWKRPRASLKTDYRRRLVRRVPVACGRGDSRGAC